MKAGTTYRNMEEYLAELEKRQGLEEAPPAAVFLMGSSQLLHLTHNGFPWLTRVRCELPARPPGPGGVELPVRATYVSANDANDPQDTQEEGYASFVRAMGANGTRAGMCDGAFSVGACCCTTDMRRVAYSVD
jgi:hypothetical protein